MKRYVCDLFVDYLELHQRIYSKRFICFFNLLNYIHTFEDDIYGVLEFHVYDTKKGTSFVIHSSEV